VRPLTGRSTIPAKNEKAGREWARSAYSWRIGMVKYLKLLRRIVVKIGIKVKIVIIRK
jgi:hypothetical protein